jgi:RND family efflux transporter MFP subunit
MRHVILALCLLALLGGCQDKNKGTKRKAQTHLVEVITVKRAPIKTTRIVTGTLESLSTIHIFNEEQGMITALLYYPGDKVKAGDDLLKLNDKIISAELAKATAAYEQAKLNYHRLKKLIPRKLASEDELARAQTAVEEARAERALLQTRLARTRVISPIDGIVSERLKEPGDVVPLHTHILSVFDPTSLIVKLNLSEILLANIAEDTRVDVRIDALGDNTFAGYVTRKYPTIDPITRQGTLEVKLDPIPAGALPGQLCRVTIATQTQALRTVPMSVVRHDARGEYVFRLGPDSKVEQVMVTTGIQLGDTLEIIDGLEDGDEVVSKGFLGLRDGKTVMVTNKKKPSSKAVTDNDNTKRHSM